MPDNWIVEFGSTSTVGAGAGGASAGPVTGLVVTHRYVRREGSWVRQLIASATRPDPVGTFAGVHLYREEPDQSLTDQLVADGSMSWDGTAALGETGDTAIPGPVVSYDADGKLIVWDGLEPVEEPTSVRVYAASVNSEGVENPLVRHGRSGATPSAVVVCPPPPDKVGPSGEEYAERVIGLTADWAYERDKQSGKPELIITTAFTFPDDPDFVGVVAKLLRGDGVEYTLTGTEPGNTTRSPIAQTPASHERMVVRVYSVGAGDMVNTYAPGITPEFVLEVDPVTDIDPVSNVTDFYVTYAYVTDPASGQTTLRLRPYWTKPNHPAYAYIEFWCLTDDIGAYWRDLGDPSSVGEAGEATINELPTTDVTWTFKAVAQDKFSMNRDGDVQTNTDSFPAGTPSFTLTIPAAPVVSPSTGFSVTASYSAPAANGKRNLLLVPHFTPPDDPAFNYNEFWAQREDGQWYELGKPARGGSSDVATVEQLPATTYTWQFLLVPYDVNGKNQDGGASTDPTSPPSGTLTYSLSIAPVPIGPAGQEYASNVTGLSVGIETRDMSMGGTDWTEFRFVLAWTRPADTRYGGAKVMVQRTSGTIQFIGDPVIEGSGSDGTRTGWQTVSGETFTVFVSSMDHDHNENSVVGSTPNVAGLTPTTLIANTLKINRADTSSFNTAEFTISPTTGKFEANEFSAGKIIVGTILRVGGGTGAFSPTFKGGNGQIAVYNSANTLRAWMGQNGTVYGGWFGELYVGGSSPVDAPLYANAGGSVIIGGINTGSTPYISLRNNLNSEVGRIGANLNGTTLQGAWLQELKISPALTSASPRIQMSGGVLDIEGANVKVVSGNITVLINATDILKVTDTFSTSLAQVRGQSVRIEDTTNSSVFSQITKGGYSATNVSSQSVFLTPSGGLSFNYGLSGVHGASSVTFNGVQVIGARRTGWVAPSGGRNRGLIFTATVTVSALAEFVAAMYDDLATHGLLGA